MSRTSSIRLGKILLTEFMKSTGPTASNASSPIQAQWASDEIVHASHVSFLRRLDRLNGSMEPIRRLSGRALFVVHRVHRNPLGNLSRHAEL
jgi:hypothetical protein